MTYKQQTLIKLLEEGKNYFEIGRLMRINQSNVHSTVYQLRKKGVDIKRRYQYPAQIRTKALTDSQRTVLSSYAQERSIPEIAKRLGITCQTVMNHASQGFKRLGFTIAGVDRIALLRNHFAKEYEEATKRERANAPITMADPAFN